LKLKTGMEKAAAFLEARRYLAYMGGTVELSKFEGLTIDPINKKLYGAMSQNRRGMEDFKSAGSSSNTFDIGGPNHVRVPYNPCGCIYAFDLSATWDVTRMYGEVRLVSFPDFHSSISFSVLSRPALRYPCHCLPRYPIHLHPWDQGWQQVPRPC